jgi:uncharacterized protein YdeI (BOF family)
MDSNITFTVPNVYNVFTCTNLHSYSIINNSTILTSFQTSNVQTSVVQSPTQYTDSNLVTYHGYLVGDVSNFTFSGNTSVYINGIQIVPHTSIAATSQPQQLINIYGDGTTSLITDITNQVYFNNPYYSINTPILPTINNATITVTGSIVNIPAGNYIIHTPVAVYFDEVSYTDGRRVNLADNTINTTQFRIVYYESPPVVTLTNRLTRITYNINDVCRTISSIELPAFIGSKTATATYKTYLV